MSEISNMRAVVFNNFGGPEELRLGEWEKPKPGENEILVKISATALNRADTLQRRGAYPPPPGASPILGLEMAGHIEELGPNCSSRWKKGDAVCALLAGGGYAEYAIIHEDMGIPVPLNLSIQEAAGIPEVFLTAFQALVWLAKLKSDETVLIHAGASGVGTAAIQIARELKTKAIYVTASKAKHQACLDLGASAAINYKAQNFEEEIATLTDGKGVNVVLDFLAAPYFQKNLNSLASDGRMVMLALMGGVKVESLNLANILRKRLHIMGSTLRARSLAYKIQLTQDLIAFAMPLFEAGKLKPVIDSVVDWKDVAEAHAYMEANKNTGKIIMEIK